MTAQPACLTYYDFFAGIGMSALGLGPSWRCLWANDFDHRKTQIFEDNFGAGIIHLEDIARVQTGALPGHADMAWASFPCQDLSLAGWRRGMTAQRSGTFWDFWRLMNELQQEQRAPRLLVIENVLGLLYGDNLTGLCEALALLNYRFGAVVIDSRHFIPQSRPRVFMVAIDPTVDPGGLTLPNVPAEPSPWFPWRLRVSFDALPPALQDRWLWWYLPQPAPRSVHLADMVTEPDEHDPAWFDDRQVERLMAMMTPKNRQKIFGALESDPTFRVFTVYKRIRNGVQRAEVRDDGLSGCLRVPGGGSSRQIMLFAEEGRIRARLMNRRELARLMGLPDHFKIPTHYNNTYRAMGDGVAAPAVDWLARHVLTPLGSRSWRSGARQALDPALGHTHLEHLHVRPDACKQNPPAA